jgi:hypothetical protein
MVGVALPLFVFTFVFRGFAFSSQNPFSFFLLLTGFLIGDPLHFVWLMPIFRSPRSWSHKQGAFRASWLPTRFGFRQDGVFMLYTLYD